MQKQADTREHLIPYVTASVTGCGIGFWNAVGTISRRNQFPTRMILPWARRCHHEMLAFSFVNVKSLKDYNEWFTFCHRCLSEWVFVSQWTCPAAHELSLIRNNVFFFLLITSKVLTTATNLHASAFTVISKAVDQQGSLIGKFKLFKTLNESTWHFYLYVNVFL